MRLTIEPYGRTLKDQSAEVDTRAEALEQLHAFASGNGLAVLAHGYGSGVLYRGGNVAGRWRIAVDRPELPDYVIDALRDANGLAPTDAAQWVIADVLAAIDAVDQKHGDAGTQPTRADYMERVASAVAGWSAL